MGDKSGTALALNDLGTVAVAQGDYAAARTYIEEGLALRREMGDKYGIAISLNTLGDVAYRQGDYPKARTTYEDSLMLMRETGDKASPADPLINLGNVAASQGEYAAAQALYEESLNLSRELGIKWSIAMSLTNLGVVAYLQGEYITARALNEESLALSQEMDQKTSMSQALLCLGLVDLAEGKLEARENILASLRLRLETGEKLQQTSSLIGAAMLVLEEGNPQFAAGLLSAVESELKGLNAPIEPEMKPLHEGTLAKVKQALATEHSEGRAAFQSAWEEGAKWSLEQAVKKALDDKS